MFQSNDQATYVSVVKNRQMQNAKQNNWHITWKNAASRLDKAMYSRLFCTMYMTAGTDILRKSTGCCNMLCKKIKHRHYTSINAIMGTRTD